MPVQDREQQVEGQADEEQGGGEGDAEADSAAAAATGSDDATGDEEAAGEETPMEVPQEELVLRYGLNDDDDHRRRVSIIMIEGHLKRLWTHLLMDVESTAEEAREQTAAWAEEQRAALAAELDQRLRKHRYARGTMQCLGDLEISRLRSYRWPTCALRSLSITAATPASSLGRRADELREANWCYSCSAKAGFAPGPWRRPSRRCGGRSSTSSSACWPVALRSSTDHMPGASRRWRRS